MLRLFPRVQFALQALLAVALVAVVVNVVVVSPYRKKERAIARLESLGAQVLYEHQWSALPGVPTRTWIPDAPLPGQAWLRATLGEHYAANVVEVQLMKSDRPLTPGGPRPAPEEFTDDDAGYIARLSTITWLVLDDTKLTDAGLQRLASITLLDRLEVERTQVTAAGVKEFQSRRPDVKIFTALD